uniref:Uncharacterized protein n=1 Tax=Strigamia maritima TaxID=126957 RepID=T1IM66_STRMM
MSRENVLNYLMNDIQVFQRIAFRIVSKKSSFDSVNNEINEMVLREFFRSFVRSLFLVYDILKAGRTSEVFTEGILLIQLSSFDLFCIGKSIMGTIEVNLNLKLTEWMIYCIDHGQQMLPKIIDPHWFHMTMTRESREIDKVPMILNLMSKQSSTANKLKYF